MTGPVILSADDEYAYPQTTGGFEFVTQRPAIEVGTPALNVLADALYSLVLAQDTCESPVEFAYVLCQDLQRLYGLGRFDPRHGFARPTHEEAA